MLNKVKSALQIATADTTFDSDITDMIAQAKIDMSQAGITNDTETDEGVIQCIILYCAYRFELLHGSLERSEALKKCYDEQKGQLGMATGYTTW